MKTLSCFVGVCMLAITPIMAVETVESSCITELNDAQFEPFIQMADKPVIIDFWAPWCPPCREMKPIFDQVAHELKDHYLFVSVNIDEAEQVAKKYDVTSIPTFKVIKNHNVIGTFVGYTTKEGVIDHIEHAIHQKFTQNTLLSAIQLGDKELVARCLAHQNIDVNAISQMQVMHVSMPMTPLMMAISTYISDQSSMDIVSMLLNAGAQIDLEINSPQMDSSMNVIGWTKETALSILEEMVKGLPEEVLAAMDDMVRQKMLECQARASTLLKFFQTLANSPKSCEIPAAVP